MFHISYFEESYWKDQNVEQYSDGNMIILPQRQERYNNVDVFYYGKAYIKYDSYEEFHKKVFQINIEVECYIDWDYYANSYPISEKEMKVLKDMETAPSSVSGLSGGRAFIADSVQIELRRETIYDDDYKKQARQYILDNNHFLEPRDKPYILYDHEGRPWSVKVHRGVKYTDYMMEPLEEYWGIHGNSMPPIGISGQSMEGGLSEAAISFLKPYVLSTFQGAISVGAAKLAASNAKTMEEAVSVITKALENNPKIQHAILKREFEKVMKLADAANLNGLPKVAEGLEKNAVDLAMRRAVNAMDNMKNSAEIGSVSKFRLAMADELAATGKALEAAGYVLILIDIMKGLNEMGHGDRSASVRVDAAFVDLGVALGTTIIGGAVEGAVGGSAGGPAGAAVGVTIGIIWGIANFVSLEITGKTVSTLAGEAIDNAVLNYVSGKQSVSGTIANHATGGVIDTRGNFNTDFSSWAPWWEFVGARH